VPTPLTLLFAGILGALIGSFGNVVIYRLPKRQSIAFPGSHCPNCGHQLSPLELIPIVSWLFLRARCRKCKTPISARYPLIEGFTALGFVLLVLRWPPEIYGLTVVPLLIIFAMIVMMSMIDIDHYLLPDSLTLPAVVIGFIGAFIYHPGTQLPTPAEAAFGGALGAGIITMINRLGSLVLRRFSDTRERLWPIGMDQVGIAALIGALGGWAWGLLAAGASFLLNLMTRRTLRLPEPVLYALWALALLLSSFYLWIDPVTAIGGSLAAAGSVSILGAFYWWFRDLGAKDSEEVMTDEDEEPIAMGFGDVKLAAVLGVMLGWQNMLVGLFLAFFIGAIGGLIMKAISGNRQVPFGPYLAIGGFIALFFSTPILTWYLGLLGIQ
jgi:leader peptidase (prepilin peptidase)/N-methyltransferase